MWYFRVLFLCYIFHVVFVCCIFMLYFHVVFLCYSTNGSLLISQRVTMSLPVCLRSVKFDSTKIDSRSKDVDLKNRQETRLKYTREARMQAQKIDKRLDQNRLTKRGYLKIDKRLD